MISARKLTGTATAILAIAAVAAAAGTGMFSRRPAPGSSIDNSAPVALATVTRGPLSAQLQQAGILGYAGNYTVVGRMRGTFTQVPSQGQVITQGQVIYRVDNSPVVLLYGGIPFYRALAEGDSGPDVAELNADLIALGDASSATISPGSDQYTWATASAVAQLQANLGVTQTGTLALGAAISEPVALRVSSVSALAGEQAGLGSPVLQSTSTGRQVSLSLDASQQSEVRPGARVTITMPAGTATPGTVSSVGRVATTASAGGPATIQVHITPSDPAVTGTLDQAPVQVTITSQTIQGALSVPVTALLAPAGGGYAVEEVTSGGRHVLIPLTLGIFDDAAGLVQVSGDIQPGAKVIEALT
jgi:hypothetical protein